MATGQSHPPPPEGHDDVIAPRDARRYDRNFERTRNDGLQQVDTARGLIARFNALEGQLEEYKRQAMRRRRGGGESENEELDPAAIRALCNEAVHDIRFGIQRIQRIQERHAEILAQQERAPDSNIAHTWFHGIQDDAELAPAGEEAGWEQYTQARDFLIQTLTGAATLEWGNDARGTEIESRLVDLARNFTDRDDLIDAHGNFVPEELKRFLANVGHVANEIERLPLPTVTVGPEPRMDVNRRVQLEGPMGREFRALQTEAGRVLTTISRGQFWNQRGVIRVHDVDIAQRARDVLRRIEGSIWAERRGSFFSSSISVHDLELAERELHALIEAMDDQIEANPIRDPHARIDLLQPAVRQTIGGMMNRRRWLIGGLTATGLAGAYGGYRWLFSGGAEPAPDPQQDRIPSPTGGPTSPPGNPQGTPPKPHRLSSAPRSVDFAGYRLDRSAGNIAMTIPAGKTPQDYAVFHAIAGAASWSEAAIQQTGTSGAFQLPQDYVNEEIFVRIWVKGEGTSNATPLAP
jgi:hypothetical protein